MTDIETRLHATSKKFPDEFGILCLDAKAEIERLKAEAAKLVDENTRRYGRPAITMQEWKDVAMAAAEDRHEYVLAQIYAGLKEEITRLDSVASGLHSTCFEQAKEIERLKRENASLTDMVVLLGDAVTKSKAAF